MGETIGIADLKPYPAMKETGVEWLGKVPVHWDVLRSRYLFKEVDHRSKTGNETHLSMSQRLGLVPSDQVQSSLTSESYAGGKLCEPEDLVLNRLKAHLGVFALAKQAGVISPDYSVFRLRSASNMTYFENTLRSPACRGELRIRAKGIVEGFWRLYTDDFYDIRLPVPPIPEQTAIVRFLDHVDRRVRRYIRAKRKLIGLLEEQKQAIIHRAVTRGLDPDVPMKDSGIDWLGQVPEHWEVRPFTRSVIERADYRGATPEKTDSGVTLVTAKNIRKGWIDYEVSREFVAKEKFEQIMRRGLPRIDDLLLTMEAPLGHAALVDREEVALAQRVVRFRMNPTLFVPQFVLQSILSPYFQDQLLSRGTGSTAQGIKAGKLPQLRILRPPLKEQWQIVEKTESDTTVLRDAVDSAQREITLLTEYRTRLTADVVIGKLDVREAAAAMLDQPSKDESEQLDQEGPAAGEGGIVEQEMDAVPEEAEA